MTAGTTILSADDNHMPWAPKIDPKLVAITSITPSQLRVEVTQPVRLFKLRESYRGIVFADKGYAIGEEVCHFSRAAQLADRSEQHQLNPAYRSSCHFLGTRSDLRWQALAFRDHRYGLECLTRKNVFQASTIRRSYNRKFARVEVSHSGAYWATLT